MLSRAKKKLPHQNIDFVLRNMENLNFSFHNLITSNLFLWWTNDLNGVIKKFYENLIFSLSRVCYRVLLTS